ncbi:PAP2 superfamily-domain-containing protein [Epithele typhae]|uniref:PAP2 superfamily-domain-containing protein n=1 Tax=Epithele typhae TaxID=378194 RepID=UPI002008A07E|nr:PAP2 superfamily-domain-containing protein [Epithele typhae]KAH9930487.1 PAP2 superfamily-domain-containing protein [Epithele typhae]
MTFRKGDLNCTLDEKAALRHGADERNEDPVAVGVAGRQPEEVYERTLSWWRQGIRRAILRNVERESPVLARMQAKIRHPFLDAYFVYTSSLGTHTFFMVMLPIFYFFGAPKFGRGLLLMLAVGVYVSSFLKDLCCAPRPFAPPVARLTIGNHHLEYGFPSTHSTNSVSLALFFYTLLQHVYHPDGPISQFGYNCIIGILCFYVFSIVFGRLYTGMHSFTDCVGGVVLGASIWGLHILIGESVDAWSREQGWIVPALIVPMCLVLVHRHPQPVDDCPCFEDAIAFNSVIMGEFVIRWWMDNYGYDASFFTHAMPGASWATYQDFATWWGTAALKMVFGVLAIFVWRIVAKSFCLSVLPPIFRLLSHLVTLPHRRFYTPATDYTTVPPEKGLRPIPSVIDLPRMMEVEMDDVAASGARANGTYGAVKQRAIARGGKSESEKQHLGRAPDATDNRKSRRELKHYDADVLTKVFVYCGIGMVATGVVPILFEVLGWGVRMS